MTRNRRARRWLVAAILILVVLAPAVIAFCWKITKMNAPTFREHLAEYGPHVDLLFQLMHPPASSLEAIERAKRGEPADEGIFEYPVENEIFHVSLGKKLNEPFWLNDEAVCLGFPNELGRWDVRRCHWEARGWRLEYATHELAWSLRVAGPGLEEQSLETVRRVAEAVFGEDEDGPARGIAFLPVNDDGQVVFGLHDVKVRYGNLDWRDALTWYHDGEAVGFISYDDNPGPYFAEDDEDHKDSWLKPYFNYVFGSNERELMFPTAREREALDALEAGRQTLRVERVAGSDPRIENFQFLIPDLRAPEGVQCLFLPSEQLPGLVRCRYQAGSIHIEQATAPQHSRVLRLRGITEPRDERQRAEHVAAELFGRPIALEVRGRYQGKTFGRVVPSENKAVRRSFDWWQKNMFLTIRDPLPDRQALRTLRWWVEGDLVGFVHGPIPEASK